MSETLESLQRKINGANDLESVVRAMKAMSASSIAQYQTAVNSLVEYYHTITLGIVACFKQGKIKLPEETQEQNIPIVAVVFGSDQGLVGQFNDSIASFVSDTLSTLPEKKEIWALGERVQLCLSNMGFEASKLFTMPNSVNAITQLIGQLLTESEDYQGKGKMKELYIFHNQPGIGRGYEPAYQRLLPLDQRWMAGFKNINWPTNKTPQIIGKDNSTIHALIREYIFVSLYKSCAESLASENSSRLKAMERAENNITELQQDLTIDFHRLRQSSIDEELFDLISGFEALKSK